MKRADAEAKRKAGSAYDQLLFEHKLEKMANTIFKNEFEMLEEAPFTATDRKFMYDAARKAQQLLRNEDIDLTLADIQALYSFLVILLGTPKPLLGLLDIVQGLLENLCEVFQEKVAKIF
jgi:hypothetical protein